MGAAATIVPAALTVAWIPLRRHLPNVDLALALVLAVTACGATGRRSRVVLAAAGAAAGFAFFDTQPYERWVVSRQPDLETLLVLVVVSLVTGELAVRVTRLHRDPDRGSLDRVREIAGLVASGAELVEVLAAVGTDLTRLLGGSASSYEAGESALGAYVVGPDGVAGRITAGRVTARPPAAGEAPSVLEVPVHGMGRVLGRFLVSDPAPVAGQQDRLLVALTLADQAGAALIAQAPESAAPPPDTPPLRPALRVVK